MNRTTEVETRVKIKANCKDVIVEFEEPGYEGFSLKLLITPEQAWAIAQKLEDAVEELHRR